MAISLSEILSARGDADYAGGGIGGNVDPQTFNNAATQQYLQDLGTMQATANKYLLDKHNERIESAISGLRNVDTKNMLPQDRDALMQQYGSVLKDTANNFNVIGNPLRDRSKWAQLQMGEAGFRSNLSQSQQDAAYLATQRKFVQDHPEFDTEEFRDSVKRFESSPVGKREYFAIQPPMIFNPTALGSTFGELAKRKYATSKTDGKYITKEEGEKIDREKYLQLWQNPGVDKYGKQIEASIQKAYAALPPTLKSLYKNYDDYKYQMAIHNMPSDQVTKSDKNEDQYGTIAAQGAQTRKTQAAQQAYQSGENRLDRAVQWARLKQDGEQMKAGKIDKNIVGEYKNNLVYNLFTGESKDRNIPNEVLQPIYGDNTKIKVKTGSAVMGQEEVTEEKPAVTVVGNYVENGKAVIMRRNNKTGKMMNNLRLPFDKVYNDFDQIQGTENAPVISSASKEWVKKNVGTDRPDLNSLHSIFGPTKKYTFNGKSYTTDQLKGMGYTQDQLDNYINSGILK
jgi:hypothetical protein